MTKLCYILKSTMEEEMRLHDVA